MFSKQNTLASIILVATVQAFATSTIHIDAQVFADSPYATTERCVLR